MTRRALPALIIVLSTLAFAPSAIASTNTVNLYNETGQSLHQVEAGGNWGKGNPAPAVIYGRPLAQQGWIEANNTAVDNGILLVYTSDPNGNATQQNSFTCVTTVVWTGDSGWCKLGLPPAPNAQGSSLQIIDGPYNHGSHGSWTYAIATAPQRFTATGSEQTADFPSGYNSVIATAVGAPGSAGSSVSGGVAGAGADGAQVSGTVPVARAPLYVEVGGAGQPGSSGGAGGFNGGGAGAKGSATGGGGGGGASDLRTCSITAQSCPGGGNSLASRLLVAAGGGGGGGSGNDGNNGGAAGSASELGMSGKSGDGGSLIAGGDGGGATASAGGSAGIGAGTAAGSGATGSGGAGGGCMSGGGGGGGGVFGGGGGGGGCGYIGGPVGGAGGAGGGSSLAPSGSSFAQDKTGQPLVELTPVVSPLFGGQAVHGPPAPTASLSDVVVHNDGSTSFGLHLRHAGKIDVLETAWNSSSPVRDPLGLAPRMVMFGRAHIEVRRARTLHVRVRPTRLGQRLVRRNHYPLTIRLAVTHFTGSGRPYTIWRQMLGFRS